MSDTPASPTTEERRLGIVVPSVNTVVEPWFAKALPDGVTAHTGRMMIADAVSTDGLIKMDHDEGMPAMLRLNTCRPHAVAYGCTASSVVQGWKYDAELRRKMTAETGVPSTTACEAIRQAMAALGARKLVIVSPYVDEIDQREIGFFEEAGYEVVGHGNLGIDNTFDLAKPTEAEIMELALGAWKPEADALLITCLNMKSHLVIEKLEKQIGKPVVTSTQATLWHLMRLAGVEGRSAGNYGRLFDLQLADAPKAKSFLIVVVKGKDRVELESPMEFDRFHVEVRGGPADPAGLAAALKGVATVDPDGRHAWVDPDALRNWPGIEQPDAYSIGLEAMLGYAGTQGWTDPETGAIQAHIETGD